jgi:hypothetical protein
MCAVIKSAWCSTGIGSVNAGVGLAERVGLGLTLHSGESQSLPIPWAVYPATASHHTDVQQQAQRGATSATTCFGDQKSFFNLELGTWIQLVCNF